MRLPLRKLDRYIRDYQQSLGYDDGPVKGRVTYERKWGSGIPHNSVVPGIPLVLSNANARRDNRQDDYCPPEMVMQLVCSPQSSREGGGLVGVEAETNG